MSWTRFAAGIFLAFALTGVSRADLLVYQYEPAVNDRFYVGSDKAFIGESYNFSGVGNTNTSGAGQWATLVSSSYFVSADHLHPAVGSTVTFFENNNPNGPSHTYTVASGQQVGTSDLFLGKLSTPISALDNIHPLAIVADNESALTGATINVYGVPNRVGLNTINGFDTVSNVTGSSAVGRAYTYDYDTTNGFGPGEAMVQVGDSGAPSFVTIGGQLALVGVHWFNYDSSGLAPAGSGDTYVSRYIPQMDALMASSGEQITVVPEPAALLLLAIGLPGVGLLLRRRS
ncbi:MAG: trypsin-like serine protease [Isosphaeraceae bacterium]